MAEKSYFGQIIKNLILVIPNIINVTSNLKTLLTIEARLAGKAVFSIILLSFVFAILLASSWLCLLAMLFMYFRSLFWSPMLSLLMIFVFNSFLLLVIGLIICRAKQALFFPELSKKCCHLYNRYTK